MSPGQTVNDILGVVPSVVGGGGGGAQRQSKPEMKGRQV